MKNKTFDIWEFTNKRIFNRDYLVWQGERTLMRPAMHCVYHNAENQSAVATDGYVLIESKKEYKPEYAGYCVYHNGEKRNDFKYVKYQQCVAINRKKYSVDMARFEQVLDETKGRDLDVNIMIGEKLCLQYKFASLLFRYMYKHKIDTIELKQDGYTIYAFSDDGFAMFMTKIPCECNDNYVIDIKECV